MEMYLSDSEIERLIRCPKTIIDQPSREEKEEGQHYRNDMKLVSVTGQEVFSVYFRRHQTFSENFSIGLVYHPAEIKGELLLFRCNGQHGSTIFGHHKSCHIHKPTEDLLRQGRKSETAIEITNAYNGYEQAVVFFAKHCNIAGRCDYIDNFKQLPLFSPCSPKAQ
jgi:hypothetical protein